MCIEVEYECGVVEISIEHVAFRLILQFVGVLVLDRYQIRLRNV